MIEIDRTRCTGCGWCADECPAWVIVEEPAQGAGRSIRVGSEEGCTLCGHCVAICPVSAVSHSGLPAGTFEERKCEITPEAMRDFLLLRRSTRAFKGDPVPREVMERLVEAGTHAGTASNAQTEGFIIVQDRELLAELEGTVIEVMWAKLKLLGNPLGRKLAGIRFGSEMAERSARYYERFKAVRGRGEARGLVLRNAPALVAVHGERTNRLARENCAIAARNMEMLAKSMGLGTCWAGFLLIAAGFSNKIARRLGLAGERNIYSAFMVGYPKHIFKKTIPRRDREVRWL